MYDTTRFVYMVVTIDKKDYAQEQLIEDLSWREPRLGRVDDERYIRFQGLVPRESIETIESLKAISPYGNGYDVKIEGLDIYDPYLRKHLETLSR